MALNQSLKLLMTLALAVLNTVAVFSQSSPNLKATLDGGSFSVSLRNKNVSLQTVQDNLNGMLGLSGDFSFIKEKEKVSKKTTHYTFQQYYQGVKVENGLVLMHTKNGTVTSVNGKVMTDPETKPDVSPTVEETGALAIAMKELGVVNTINHYQPELVIYYGSNTPELAYKVRIDGRTEKRKIVMYHVYVSAVTGMVLNKINLIAHADVPGTANTLYSGTRDIVIDQFSGGYRLRDNGRKIETYDVGGQPVVEDSVNKSLYANPNDIVNDTTHWGKSLNLLSTTLQHIGDSETLSDMGVSFQGFSITGSIPRSKIDKHLPTGEYENLADEHLFNLMQTQPGQPIVPPLKHVLDIRIDADKYRGAFIKDSVDITFNPDFTFSYDVIKSDTAHVIEYIMDTLTEGIHQWNDGKGSTGTYQVGFTSNPAVDAHWGIEQSYDFYKENFEYISYDNAGSVIRNYYNGVEQIAGTQNNAAGIPAPYNCMLYGTGDGVLFNPVVSLDVTGHEFTHLVTGNNSNLAYQGESGALNESFSDMMGAAIEFFSNGNAANWILGEGVAVAVPYFRSLADPKSTGSFNDPNFPAQPDTYEGDHWASTANPSQLNDNGGVHTNSGVGNKWFYLLSNGGSGTNDNNYIYNIAPIGIAKAQALAFTAFTDYLTPNSQYIDAYHATLEVTADQYGENSTEYATVKEAWKAVGIPKPGSVGTKDPQLAIKFELYPNPTNGVLNINSTLDQAIEAKIYNAVGMNLGTIKVKPGVNKVDISSYSTGVYLVNYSLDNATYTQKVIIH